MSLQLISMRYPWLQNPESTLLPELEGQSLSSSPSSQSQMLADMNSPEMRRSFQQAKAHSVQANAIVGLNPGFPKPHTKGVRERPEGC